MKPMRRRADGNEANGDETARDWRRVALVVARRTRVLGSDGGRPKSFGKATNIRIQFVCGTWTRAQ